ncbi:MAG: hypothetical protein KGH55_02815 [Nanoarchaeota archaeon]|nr:hypothetical protein [Nanoarchaeota archaeon]
MEIRNATGVKSERSLANFFLENSLYFFSS